VTLHLTAIPLSLINTVELKRLEKKLKLDIDRPLKRGYLKFRKFRGYLKEKVETNSAESICQIINKKGSVIVTLIKNDNLI